MRLAHPSCTATTTPRSPLLIFLTSSAGAIAVAFKTASGTSKDIKRDLLAHGVELGLDEADPHPRMKEADYAAPIDIAWPQDCLDFASTFLACTPLLDPIFEGRTIASKRVQATKSLSVERLSFAQGLYEELVHLGPDVLVHSLRDDIIQITRHPKDAIRQCVLWVITFLPPALDNSFFLDLSLATEMVPAFWLRA
ncbi:hypothetical protein SDRG_14877 [Saprolegnia diclina VS20]|uniref:Uncharacterized protein n=1 Tax=Saprolegnia diclina (strain VS20) TaxID=1156394 RepID=T0Q1J7_SAPDV|nr:hypothetical protein SDRG_14877 [Saprolegnia diclina VS20]EQC27255.1 hypothetical protein SDRG_14877 [Saprolegnia diclina VS20]|eukprot:XP_008619258.1 hypothetical protein SDRG_14877 [Saprolegnia diclina VS20]